MRIFEKLVVAYFFWATLYISGLNESLSITYVRLYRSTVSGEENSHAIY